MEIKLTEKERAMLKQYASVFHEERKFDFTATPIVAVQKRERVPTAEGYNVDGYWYEISIDCNIDGKWDNIFIKDETPTSLYEIETQIIKKLNRFTINEEIIEIIACEISDELIDGEGLERKFEYDNDKLSIKVKILLTPFTFNWHNVAYFFTRLEAENYIQYQHNNFEEWRPYALYSGYNNKGDFPVFQKLLLRMGKQLCVEDK